MVVERACIGLAAGMGSAEWMNDGASEASLKVVKRHTPRLVVVAAELESWVDCYMADVVERMAGPVRMLAKELAVVAED